MALVTSGFAGFLVTASLGSESPFSKNPTDKKDSLFIHVLETADSSRKPNYPYQKKQLPKQLPLIDITELSEDNGISSPSSHSKNSAKFGTALVSNNYTENIRSRCWTSPSHDVSFKNIASEVGLEIEAVRDVELNLETISTSSSFKDRVSPENLGSDTAAYNDDSDIGFSNEDFSCSFFENIFEEEGSDVSTEIEDSEHMNIPMQKQFFSDASTFSEDEFDISESNCLNTNDHLVNSDLNSLMLNAVTRGNEEEEPDTNSRQELNYITDNTCADIKATSNAELDNVTQDSGEESPNQGWLRSVPEESTMPDLYHNHVDYGEAKRSDRHNQKTNVRWEKVWQSKEECTSASIPSIYEDEYTDIINMVLEMTRSLPKNITLQEQLDPLKGHINTVCGNVILYRLQKEGLYLHAMSFFEWMWLHTPCLLDSRSLCTMFKMLGAANKADRVFLLFENLKDRKELWTVQVLNAALSSLSKLGRHDESLKFFQEMLKMGINVDSVTLSTLINSAEKNGSKVEHIWKMFCRMEQQNVFASHEVFGALIKVFCNKGMKEEALKLMSEMEKRGLVLNAVIYNTVIDAYGKSGMLEEAEGLISDMQKQGLAMTVVTYNCLIAAYGKQRMFEAAEALMEEMLVKGPLPNERTYTILIAAYGRHGLTEKAVNVFLRMKRNGISPNPISYTALIHAYAETGWHKKAEYAFQSMIREGIVPTVETYTSLLHGYRQAGDIEKVKTTWKLMCKENCKGTQATFNVLMDAFAKHGCYAEARDVMYEFNRNGYKPDIQTYNILINAYARGCRHSRIPEILEEMKSKGITPDSFTYTTVIYSYLRVRDFSMAFKYHDVMLKDNQVPDFLTYSKLRSILDAQHEIKSQRNMKSSIGLQRKKYESAQNANPGKRSWERRKATRNRMRSKMTR